MIPKTITDNAACKGLDTKARFYRGADSVKNVRKFRPLSSNHVCFSCPVMIECREYGLYNEVFGTWGGMKEFELDSERKRLGIPSPSYMIGAVITEGERA